MTISEEDILRDQSERSGLQKAIADVETALSVSTPGTRRILENSLEGMKGRVATLDKKIGDAIHEREVQAQAQAAIIAAQAQKEARLSESEKQAYSGFLAKEFFTKQDFKSLDQFYSKSWDRLSEDGKEEMSHRVWEGVRRDEYKFTDLPQSVQEKEEKRAYSKFAGASIGQSALADIPEADRKDFIEAYQSGDRKIIGRVLDRNSFRQNMALETSTGVRHKSADAKSKAANDEAMTKDMASNAAAPDKEAASSANPAALANLAADSLNLSGVRLVDASSSGATIPDASGPWQNAR